MSAALEREAAFVADVRRVADGVAASAAADVDREARFPVETIDALREARALGAAVDEAPVGLRALAQASADLARACSSSAMIFAMHQIQVLTMARHAEPGGWFCDYLRDVAADQRLVASVTSEVGTGGDMGRSVACVERDGADAGFRKEAPTVSYGAHADDFLTTLRRAPDAEGNDQVLALSLGGQTTLEPAGTWDAMGMRGTCSPGFVVAARFPARQVLDVPFARVAAESMVPLSHVLWSHVWLGIASAAYERARRCARAGRTGGGPPSSADGLARVAALLTTMRGTVAAGLDDLVAHDEDREALATMAAAVRFNNLKLAASDQAAEVCLGALRVCGMRGYRSDSPYDVGRHVRDALSAPLMIANDRIRAANAGMLLVVKELG